MKRYLSVIRNTLLLWLMAMLTFGSNAYAAGGAITLTPSTTNAVAGDLVTFTAELDTNNSLFVNSAGVILQWDQSVFALDASSAGTSDDNDPQGTSYLDAFGNEQNDDNNRLTITTTGTSDLFEMRFSDNDTSSDPLTGTSGQAYVNNTRLSAINAGGSTVANVTLFSVTLKVKAGASAGASTVQAKVISISDDQGSASDGSSFTVGSSDITVSVPTLSLTTAGDNQTGTVGAALPTNLQVTAQTGSTLNAGVDVTFTAPTGSVFTGETTTLNTVVVTTDSSGVATAPALTIPQTTLGAQTVTVSATGYSDQTFDFTATADVATAAQSTLAADGSSTITIVDTATFTVTFIDQYGNATSDLNSQALTATGESLAGATWAIADNGNGTATATYTASTSGSESSLAVALAGTQVGDLQSLTVLGQSLTLNTGSNNQTATAGSALATALQVTALTGSTPNDGVDVTFTAPTGAVFAGSSTNTETVTTSGGGIAIASALTIPQLGLGEQSVTVSATGYDDQTFSFTATAGPADAAESTVVADGGAEVSINSTATYTVTFLDQFGNATSDLNTQVLAASGETLASATWTVTDNTDGTATATYDPASTAGTEAALVVTLGGTQIGTIPALAVVTPTIAKTAGDVQTGTVGEALTTALSVTLTTGSSNDSGVSVTFTAPADASFASSGTNSEVVVTDGSGVATASALTLNGTVGFQGVTVSATGYLDQTFNITGTPAAADAGLSTIATVGSGSITADGTETFTVTFLDAFGNATTTLGGQTLAASGAALTSATFTVVDNGDGTATATYTPFAEGSETALVVTLDGTTIDSAQSVTVANGVATQLSLVASPAVIASDAGTGSSILTVTVQDAKGNTVDDDSGINGTNATFAITAGGSLATLDSTTTAFASGVASVGLTAITDTTGGTVTISVNGASLTADTVDVTTTPFFVNQSVVTLVVGDTFTFTVPANSTTTPTWAQTTGATGSILSSPSGLSNIYTAVAAGSDTVTVSGTIGGSGIDSSATITVVDPVTTSITSTTGVVVGNAFPVLAFGGDESFAYTSGDTAVLTVDSAGLVTAVAAGITTVTVDDQVVYDGATTSNTAATANIQVVDPLAVTSATTVYLDTNSANTSTITATGGTAAGEYGYSSGDTAVVTVDANGVLTAVAAGTTTVDIIDNTFDNVVFGITVTVNAPLDASVGGSAISGTQTVASGGTLTFTPAGGTGSYSVAATGGSVSSPTDGAYVFTAPTQGGFAGDYTITVTDSTSGLSYDITVSVPLKVVISETNILETDTTQIVTVTGGAVGDSIDMVALASNGTEDTGNAILTLATPATAIDDSTNGNPAVASVTPADVTAVTAFTIRATNSTNTGLAAVDSDTSRIIPVVTYSGTVVDSLDAPVDGALVEMLTEVSGIADITTGTDGAFSFSLPDTGAVYQFAISATGMVKRQLSSSDIGVAGTARLALDDVPSTGVYTVTGTVSLSAGTDRTGAKVKLFDGTNFSDEQVLGADGAYAFYLDTSSFASPASTAYKSFASMQGFDNNSQLDDGGAGDATANDGVIDVLLTAKAAEVISGGSSGDDEVTDVDEGLAVTANTSQGDGTLAVELPPGGVDAQAGTVFLVVSETDNSGATDDFTNGSEYLFEVSLVIDDDGTPGGDSSTDTDVDDADINRVVVTMPFDTSVVSPGSLEAGTFVIWHADTVAELQAGSGTAVAVSDILFTDYIAGLVTFEVNSLSFFGVGSPLANTDAPAVVGGSGCFIATAAFGSYQDPYVNVLRDFRDQQLMTNAGGQWFVQQYYTHSPAFADWLRGNETARTTVRMALWPVIGAAMLLDAPLYIQLALLLAVMGLVVGFIRRRRNRNALALSA